MLVIQVRRRDSVEVIETSTESYGAATQIAIHKLWSDKSITGVRVCEKFMGDPVPLYDNWLVA